ncbi:hypothetical protein SAMN05421872_109235 [Nocardioides lianchengensis]|uniref:Uncharacterized protein n=1 Tax=Nocardioides lianchengensis TaxID=1045774 RepID=A0A1G6WBD1_9ACTN|nr:hypothetical protein SAMN05421872_109235 [Nocardioides lianchengensis]
MNPRDPIPLSLVRPRPRSVVSSRDFVRAHDRDEDQVGSFVDLVRLLLPVSSLSAQRAALVRQDLRLLQQEARREPAGRPAVCQALMAALVEELADGVSSFSLRSLQARAQPVVEPEPA